VTIVVLSLVLFF